MKRTTISFSPAPALIIFSIVLSGLAGCTTMDPADPAKGNSPSNADIYDTAAPVNQQEEEISMFPDAGKMITDISRPDSSAATDSQAASSFFSEQRTPLALIEIEDLSSDALLIHSQTSGDLWQHLSDHFELEYSRQDDAAIAAFEKWYSDRPKYFERIADRAYWYMPYILDQVLARRMPAEVALLPAIESAFRPEAVSGSNAMGMWQFIAATGTRFGLRRDWWMEGRRDLVQSTRAALDYLEYLSAEFDGDWELVFAAYNAGEGTISREIKKNRAANKPTTYPYLSLRKETTDYVPRLFAVRNIIMDPRKYGIVLKSIPNEQTLTVLDVRTQTDLTVAAALIPISDDQLLNLNLGYKRGVTPPNGPHQIVVPSEFVDQLESELEKLSLQERLQWARHQVKEGDYLGKIAGQHGVTINSIKMANNLTSNLIKPGQELKIPISLGGQEYASASSSNVKTQGQDKVYTVRKGDSLWAISQSNGVSLAALLRWNDISKHATLMPGQQLIVGKSS